MTKPLPSDDKTHQNNKKYLKRKALTFVGICGIMILIFYIGLYI